MNNTKREQASINYNMIKYMSKQKKIASNAKAKGFDISSLRQNQKLLLKIYSLSQNENSLEYKNIHEMNEEFHKSYTFYKELTKNKYNLLLTFEDLILDEDEQLVDYIKGGERPDFVDLMLTQTNGKLNELLKVMSILQLVQLPKLYDYQRALQENLLNPETLKDMTVNELSTEAVNIQKQISDILSTALKINTQTNPDNAIPTKVEKIANQLMCCSEATRNRVIEILEADQQE